MTREIIAVKGLDDAENQTANLLLNQLAAKTRRNLLRASYYDGKRAIRQVGTVIPPQYYRLGIVLGWAAKAVDTLADRCNLDDFVWPDGTLDDIGYSEFADDNDLLDEVDGAKVASLLFGVAFLVNTLGGDREPKSLLHVKDALNATGEWNARRRRLDSLLSVTERHEGKPTEFVLYLDGETVTVQKDGGWKVVDRSEHSWGVPVEPLVYKPQGTERRPFGTSRISRPVMSLHDQALRTVIRMEGHMDVYSFPELWLLGADESIFKNADGSRKAAWQVMLGRIKAVPDNEDAEGANQRADVKQFTASDPDAHLKALRQQAQLFAGETSVPLTSLGVSDMSNPTSADSYIASREDLMARAERATGSWSAPLRRAVIRGLMIQGGKTEMPKGWRSIQPKWRSPLYLSRAAQADAGSKQLAAVPWLGETEVGLELLGLDSQQIDRAMADKRRAAGRAVLAQLGSP